MKKRFEGKKKLNSLPSPFHKSNEREKKIYIHPPYPFNSKKKF
jgi:hypothetical protein